MMIALTNWTFDISKIMVGAASIISAYGALVVTRVRRDQKPNGGATLRDAIDRIETKQAHNAAESSTRLAAIEATQVDHGRQISHTVAAIDRLEGRVDHLTDDRKPR